MKKAALLSGAAGLSGTLLESIQRAKAIEPATGSTFWDAEHVVILMQENRSFDHAFGTLRGVRGFNDPRAITLPDGNPVWVQTNAAGESYVPFRLNIKDTSATWMGSLPHNWTDQVDATNRGRHDRWLEAKRSGDEKFADMPLTLGHYNREDIPFYYELADAFTICDQHFCSSLTGTTPNRLHLWTGTIRPQQNADAKAHVLNSDADFDHEVNWPTFPERLEDLGVSWKIYQNEVNVGVGFTEEEDAWLSNFGDNPIEYFKQFNVRFSPAHRRYLEAASKSLPAAIAKLERDAAAAGANSTEAARLAAAIKEKKEQLKSIAAERTQWTQENFDRLSPREKNLHIKAFCTNVDDPHQRELETLAYQDGDNERREHAPKGDLLHQFRQDVKNGALPTVSWVVPPERFSDHPSSAWYGAWYIAEMLDILTQNPAVWKKTIFILTYDENDGYFDHVPPFGAPHPRRPETGLVSQGIDASLEYVEREQELMYKSAGEARDSSIGLGYRVPMVIASPWSRGGCVCSQVFDHTSPLQFLEKLLSHKLGSDVKETNINRWRRTVCGDLTASFQPYDGEVVEAPAFPARDEFIKEIHQAKFKSPPSNYQKLTKAEIDEIRQGQAGSPLLPRQEPGVRRSCPLPYELAADGMLSSDGRRFTVQLAAGNEVFGKEAAGSPFMVYSRHGAGDVRTRNYAVTAGDRLEDSWSLGDFAGGQYDLAVHGPNGFYREFRGGGDDPTLEIRLDYGRDSGDAKALDGAVEIHVSNRDKGASHTIEIADLAYKTEKQRLTVAPGESKVCRVDALSSFGWYDLGVRVAGNESFAKRYAGRVETGKWSFSDPAMGGAAT